MHRFLRLRDYLQPATLVTSALLVLILFSVVLLSVVLQGIYVIAAVVLSAFAYREVMRLTPSEKNTLIALVVFTAIVLPINGFRTPTSVLHFTIMMAGIAGALFATHDRAVYKRASFVVLAITQAIIIGFLVVRGTTGFPLDEMLAQTSSNGITSIVICLQINLCVANMLVSRKTSFITVSITLYICIIGYGRGSILAAGLIWVVTAAYASAAFGRSTRLIAGALLIAVIAYVGITNYHTIFDFFEVNTKVGAGLYDDARATINQEYWSRMTGIYLVIGASFDGSIVERFFNGNPHNSYIRGHHYLGLAYILIMTAMAVRPLVTNMSIYLKGYHALMMGILLFRASTEPILFPTPLDLIFFALFFLYRSESDPRVVEPTKFVTRDPRPLPAVW